MFKNKIYYALFLVLGLVYTQDPPLGFEYNQGTEQRVLFFQNISIDGQQLDENDWIGAFKKYDESQNGECTNDEINFDETMGGMCSSTADGFVCTPGFPDCSPEDCTPEIDVNNDGELSVCACPDLNNDGLLASQNLDLCVGSRRYGDCLDGRNCDIPVMGYDGYCYSGGYILPGETPYFKIYDNSENEYYFAFASVDTPWQPFIYELIDDLTVTYDCYGTLGGNAIVDECGYCCDGNTGVDCSYYNSNTDYGGAYDCNQVCDGPGYLDGCGFCVNGPEEECGEDCNGDLDGDAVLDDCGVCSGGNTGITPNIIDECSSDNWESFPDLDCNCDCFGTAFLDYCDVCSEGLTSHIANSDIDCSGYDDEGNIILKTLMRLVLEMHMRRSFV